MINEMNSRIDLEIRALATNPKILCMNVLRGRRGLDMAKKLLFPQDPEMGNEWASKWTISEVRKSKLILYHRRT